MDEDLLRVLLAQRESTDLDFKRAFHADDAEFTKDLMAMANLLPAGKTAHIIFGVDEDHDSGTGIVVGLDGSKQLGDADFHQMVKDKLNKVPTFAYSTNRLDEHLVGAITITGDRRRPFFPIRARGALQRLVPLIRRGTTTDVGSPDEVIGWYREDHGAEEEQRRLTLDNLRADRMPLVEISALGRSHSRGQKISRDFKTTNLGTCTVRVVSVALAWRPSAEFISTVAASNGPVHLLKEEFSYPSNVTDGATTVIRPGEVTQLAARLNQILFDNGLKEFGLPALPIETKLIDSRLEVVVESLPHGERHQVAIPFEF